MPSSAGGTAVSTSATSPSAGATTTPGRFGGTRCGCRKNVAHAAADASPARRTHLRLRPTAATARGVSTNGRPAGCSGGTAALTRPMTWPTPVGWGVPGGVGRRATGSSYLFECDGGVCRSC
uniref:Uncharacterized protein n=1 Tax=Rhodococcus hoagii TaxID=43767 RepID=Q93QI6_RHOHA|nr:unknown [Prescottella equi]